jgi:CBS domain-containing protein
MGVVIVEETIDRVLSRPANGSLRAVFELALRDVAILLLEKRISAVPVLAANLELLGMVSEGDLMVAANTDRVARRD